MKIALVAQARNLNIAMGSSKDSVSINSNVVQVVVGIIINSSQEMFMTQRALSLHQGGLWEFPGGKVEPGETLEEALKREFQEEIGINIIAFEPLTSIIHHYPAKSVQLHTYLITQYSGQPSICDGQLDMRWIALSAWNNRNMPVPESNLEIIKLLNNNKNSLL